MSLAMIICGPICAFLIPAFVPRWGRVKVLVAIVTIMAAGAALYSGVRESCADGQSECMGAATAYGVGLIWLLFLILALVINQIRAQGDNFILFRGVSILVGYVAGSHRH